jgi:hypothetical protein
MSSFRVGDETVSSSLPQERKILKKKKLNKRKLNEIPSGQRRGKSTPLFRETVA